MRYVVMSVIALGLFTVRPVAVQLPPGRQLSIWDRSTIDGTPGVPAKGWALTPESDADTEVPGVVSTHGPGVRITAAADVTVFRPEWKLAGEFTVSAMFQSQDSTPRSASYGLTVGGQEGMAFLIRGDSTFAVQHLKGAQGASGRFAPSGTVPEGTATAKRLEVRVGATQAAFVVDGKVVVLVPITAGQLDGAPGVYVAAQGDVAVAGFAVQSAATLLIPNLAK